VHLFRQGSSQGPCEELYHSGSTGSGRGEGVGRTDRRDFGCPGLTHDLSSFTAGLGVKSDQNGHHRRLPIRRFGAGCSRITDSVSGQLLEAWADKRMGGASIENVDVFWWGDAKNVMDYWANGLDQRLVLLGTQQTALTAAAN
jgi:hypothetical protein